MRASQLKHHTNRTKPHIREFILNKAIEESNRTLQNILLYCNVLNWLNLYLFHHIRKIPNKKFGFVL